jgi:hypothetical protein
LDDITGDAPFGTVKALLDRRDPAGNWQETKIKAVMTPSGNLTYPGLERHPDVNGPPRRYRCRIEAQFYGPLYQAVQDGIEFDAFPYNDTNPPANFPPPPNLPLPQDVVLTPASNYPFEPHINVLRGRTVDVNGDPVADAVVNQGIQERVLTDRRGVFALPLRWVLPNVLVPIDAVHPRTGRTGTISIMIPQDLGQNHDIQIT